MEYDSRILVSSVNLICQDFQCVFRYEYLVPESIQGEFIVKRKSLLCFAEAGLSKIKKWQQNKLENRWFVTNYSWDIYEQLQVHNSIIPIKKSQWIQRVSASRLVTLLGLS